MDPLFELIQLSVGARDDFPSAPATMEQWQALLDRIVEQSLVGVTYPAVERLSRTTPVPIEITFPWAMAVDEIRKKNKRQNEVSGELHRFFKENGFRSCVIKGPAAATYYPRPELRQGGDIDIWVEGERQAIVDFLRSRFPVLGVVYHHCHANIVKGMEVEVHFTPTWMNRFFVNRRLQKWFGEQAGGQFSNFKDDLGFCIPQSRFDGVFLLLHIYRHVLDEGVGLRQLLDYHYLLMNLGPEERICVVKDLKRLGMMHFATEVMYVLREVFNTPEAALLCQPDPRGGAFLLNSVLISGNFGHSDARNAHDRGESLMAHGWRKVSRNLSLLFHYPGEVLAMPFYMTWQYFWRRRHGYLYKGR